MAKSGYARGVMLLLAGVIITLSAICLWLDTTEELTLSLH